MNIQLKTEPFHYLEIKDLFTQKESEAMLNECLRYAQSGKLKSEEHTQPAKDKYGNILKKNKGIYLSELYDNPEKESQISLFQNNFWNLSRSKSVSDSWYFNNKAIKDIETAVFYYGNNDHYKAHYDETQITTISWFWKNPKKFEGGDLVFPGHNLTIKCEENYTIAFPGNILHEVTPIIINEQDDNDFYGRFTISNFFN